MYKRILTAAILIGLPVLLSTGCGGGGSKPTKVTTLPAGKYNVYLEEHENSRDGNIAYISLDVDAEGNATGTAISQSEAPNSSSVYQGVFTGTVICASNFKSYKPLPVFTIVYQGAGTESHTIVFELPQGNNGSLKVEGLVDRDAPGTNDPKVNHGTYRYIELSQSQ